MIIQMRKVIHFIRFLISFTVLTILLYHLVSWTFDLLTPRFQYKKPFGKSIEVHVNLEHQEQLNLKERLYYFLHNGE